MKKIILFVLCIGIYSCVFAQEKDKYDTIVFYDAKIVNQHFLSIIDSFLVHEEENVTYYLDSMSLIIYFGYLLSGDSNLIFFEIKPFPIEFFYQTREYAYYKYKNHIIYFTHNIDNPLNDPLFTKRNKHGMIKKHFEDKKIKEKYTARNENNEEIEWEEYIATEFDKMLEMQTSWQYFYVNETFKEYRKICPCCFYRSNCNKKKGINYKTE